MRQCRVCGCTDDCACLGGCYWVEYDLCSRCYNVMQFSKILATFDNIDSYTRRHGSLNTIAIYCRPDDYPNGYIGRLFYGTKPTNKVVVGSKLEEVRKKIPRGYIKFCRKRYDVPSLIESWIY